jgi:hypothetical protein
MLLVIEDGDIHLITKRKLLNLCERLRPFKNENRNAGVLDRLTLFQTNLDSERIHPAFQANTSILTADISIAKKYI